jgi:hypothetical protein
MGVWNSEDAEVREERRTSNTEFTKIGTQRAEEEKK